MTDITLKFDFDELVISIHGNNDSGVSIFGSADLCPNYADEPAEGFCVKTIFLQDGARLDKNGTGELGFPSAFEAELFKRMAAVIENDKTRIGRHAAEEWAENFERLKEAA
jgi:histidinol phosphatase-like PHP family hydrolase